MTSIFSHVLIVAGLLLSLGCQYQSMRDPVSVIELKTANMQRQSREFTCGAAALATVMSLLGTPTTEMQVLDVILADTRSYRINDSGLVEIPPFSAATLQNIARQAGFKAITLQAQQGNEALAAIEQLKPVICRLMLYQDYLHFVVVRDIANGWVSIADPAYGNIRVPVAQFHAVWEAGDRALLAISKRPFPAWKSDEGQVFVKRDASETIPLIGEVAPVSLYSSALRSISLSNAITASRVEIP